MQITLNPYLNFNGNTREAMEFYKSILGGELDMQTFGESDMPIDDQYKDQVIHAQLIGDMVTIMASDTGQMGDVTFGNNVHLSLNGSDDGQLRSWFEKLSEGGNIDMPLEKQFWGDTFGMLTDKFGIHWMVNISTEKSE